MSNKQQSDEKRASQRMALTAHLAGSMLRAWGEQFPDSRKLAMRSVYLADYILAVLDAVPEGEIDPSNI